MLSKCIDDVPAQSRLKLAPSKRSGHGGLLEIADGAGLPLAHYTTRLNAEPVSRDDDDDDDDLLQQGRFR